MRSKIWMHPLAAATVLTAFIGAIAIGCGSDQKGDCVSTCKAAQAQSCTSIKDCDKTCAAGVALASKANCQSQLDNYQSCADSSPTCEIDSRCGNQQGAFTNCAGAYCLKNPTDSDCQAMLNP